MRVSTTTLVLVACYLVSLTRADSDLDYWNCKKNIGKKIQPKFCKSWACPAYTIAACGKGYEKRCYGKTKWAFTGADKLDETSFKPTFQRLYKYISGANDKKKKLGMTLPVLVPMSYNVTDHKTRSWMGFYMVDSKPPTPTDDKVKIVSAPKGCAYVRSFPGLVTGQRSWLMYIQMGKLSAALKKDGITWPAGKSSYAGYNFFHNEIWRYDDSDDSDVSENDVSMDMTAITAAPATRPPRPSHKPWPTWKPRPTWGPRPSHKPWPTWKPRPSHKPWPTWGPRPSHKPWPTWKPRPSHKPWPTRGPRPSHKPWPTWKPRPSHKPWPTRGPRPSHKPWPTKGPRPSHKPWPTWKPRPSHKPWPTWGPRPSHKPWPTWKPQPTDGPSPDCKANLGKLIKPKFCGKNDCPSYTVSACGNGYEKRCYEPTSWVSTMADKLDETDTKPMFWKLFKYISGNNDKKQKIKMTVPVIVGMAYNITDHKTKVSMSFYLANASAPTPNDASVRVFNAPKGCAYVRSFGGYVKPRSKIMYYQLYKLSKALKADGITYARGMSAHAGYNDPKQLFNRHTEVWRWEAKSTS